MGSGVGDNGDSGNGRSGGNSIDGETGAAASGHHGLPTGAIAAVAVVAAFLLLGLLLVFCRRRAIRKRVAFRDRWFRSQQAGISSSGYFRNNKSTSKPPSVRSSFGTNIDYDPLRDFTPPPLPLGPDWPLTPNSGVHSEMIQANGGTVTLPAAAATASTAASPTIRSGSERDSIESLIMLGAGDENLFRPMPSPSRGLTINSSLLPPSSDDSHNTPTPMSVRPFSPTERWSFPTPPDARNPLRKSAQVFHQSSPPTSQAASVNYHPPRTTSTSPISDDDVEFHTAAEDSSPENPFADFASSNDHTTVETFHTATTTSSRFTIERVSRPFAPALSDEIAVSPGDEVRILKQFDDGWAYAEVISTGTRGLFPIDCLRSPDVDLPAFLASKRLSSYAGFVMPPTPVKLVH